jgi:hypothetical protein
VARNEQFPSGAAIRDFMPDQHRLFFAQLPYMVAATVDETGAPVASLLVGEEGFVASPDPRTLAIAAHPASRCSRHFRGGAPIGLLGIDCRPPAKPRQRRHRATPVR